MYTIYGQRYISFCLLKYSSVLFVCFLWHFYLYYRYLSHWFTFLNKINVLIFASLLYANFSTAFHALKYGVIVVKNSYHGGWGDVLRSKTLDKQS